MLKQRELEQFQAFLKEQSSNLQIYDNDKESSEESSIVPTPRDKFNKRIEMKKSEKVDKRTVGFVGVWYLYFLDFIKL